MGKVVTMKLEIGNKEVKVSERNGAFLYEYFACDCKVEDREFLDGLLDDHKKDNHEYFLTQMVIELNLSNCYISTIFADQWAVVLVKSEDTDDEIRVQCDKIEHGVAVAVEIARKIEKARDL